MSSELDAVRRNLLSLTGPDADEALLEEIVTGVGFLMENDAAIKRRFISASLFHRYLSEPPKILKQLALLNLGARLQESVAYAITHTAQRYSMQVLDELQTEDLPRC